MKEAESLMDRAEKYINSASLLIENEDFDSAASRAYYAMFYSTEALLMTKDLKFSSHKGVISAFGEHFVKTGIFSKELRRKLQNAFDERQRGDYSFHPVISQEDARRILQDAKDFIAEIKKYLISAGVISSLFSP